MRGAGARRWVRTTSLFACSPLSGGRTCSNRILKRVGGAGNRCHTACQVKLSHTSSAADPDMPSLNPAGASAVRSPNMTEDVLFQTVARTFSLAALGHLHGLGDLPAPEAAREKIGRAHV